jgi:hypothetical protein
VAKVDGRTVVAAELICMLVKDALGLACRSDVHEMKE